jgi:hypothetical protein
MVGGRYKGTTEVYTCKKEHPRVPLIISLCFMLI